MTVKDLLRNHDKTDHIYVIYIYQRTFKNCLYESQFFRLPKCISEREPSLLSLIEVGKIYYLDETSLYVDSDGDEYAKIYKDKWRKEYIGNMLTKHFCEPIFCD